MSFKTLFIIFSCLLLNTVEASNHLILLGGGGETDCKADATTGPSAKPNCDQTIFDSGIRELSNKLDFTSWKYEISFDGGHLKTENILTNNYPIPQAPTTNFTVTNFNNILKSYEQKIISGKIKSGDKLLIFIAAHGDIKRAGQITHSIAAEGSFDKANKDNLDITSLVSLDQLSTLVKLADKYDVKLGIVDFSCRSGNTLALAQNSKNTCVISGTGLGHYAYIGTTGFSGRFLTSLTSGKNLEEMFLKARRISLHPEYPMISTEMNEKIVDFTYKSITPYLFNTEGHDLLTEYMIMSSSPQTMCKRDEQFGDLIKQISSLEDLTARNFFKYDGSEFKRLLTLYKKNQDQILSKLTNNNKKLENVEKFTLMMKPKGKPQKPLDLELTWQKILSIDIDSIIKRFETFSQETETTEAKETNQYVADIYKQVALKKNEILKTDPKLLNVRENTKKLVSLMEDTKGLSEKIIAEEKLMYDMLYKKYAKESATNNCREFTF